MDWMNIVKTVAPWIGTALGGPLGGMAVEAAANALGISDKTTDAVKQALAGVTPDQMLALKQIRAMKERLDADTQETKGLRFG